MTSEYRPKAETALETRPVDGQVLVHDAAHDKVHLLNAGAARVLELCNGKRTVAEIVAIMARDVEVDAARVSQDVVSILQSFTLLRLVDEAPAT